MQYFIIALILHNVSTTPSKIVSLVHASVVSCISLFHMHKVWDTPFSESHPYGSMCASITLQYMIYDLYHIRSAIFYLHHGMAIVACLYTLYFNRFQILVLFVELNEISTIPLNFLDTHSLWAKVTFAASFFICRILLLTWIVFCRGVSDPFLNTLLCVHLLVNSSWYAKIIRKALR